MYLVGVEVVVFWGDSAFLDNLNFKLFCLAFQFMTCISNQGYIAKAK